MEQLDIQFALTKAIVRDAEGGVPYKQPVCVASLGDAAMVALAPFVGVNYVCQSYTDLLNRKALLTNSNASYHDHHEK